MFTSLQNTILQILVLGITLFMTLSAAAEDIPEIKFSKIYGAKMELAKEVKELEGKTLKIKGFMAPPLETRCQIFCAHQNADGDLPLLR